ncbi:MAG: hypothetical protein ABI903_03400 [Actinomycetota bacterium]
MTSLAVGSGAMGGMKVMSQGLLPPWVTWLWLVALAAVLVIHCGHLVRMGGQHRWYHASHILMLVSMLYMFAMMEFTWTWFPRSWSISLFVVSTAALAVWMVLRLVQRRPFSALWITALIMQASMIYMWIPKASWATALIWTMVVYFGLETVAWLAGLLDDSKPAMAVGPSVSAMPGLGEGPGFDSTQTTAGGLLVTAKPATVEHRAAEVLVHLADDSLTGRIGMAVMAASMAYMLAAMQLMR